ncbi:outer membrane beta-barrel protein [Telluribacter humicola]|uniref:outer membrane beta-barrel protein n=1 Tax=Telluribacter humicola TaxID=1720261 RepID=UPI001A959145|nr:outer membrane beta-barrel protein [Telluribacter humicola]
MFTPRERKREVKKVYGNLLGLLCLSLLSFQSFSQGVTIQGSVQNASDKSMMPGAIITIQKATEEKATNGVMTDGNGDFKFDKIAPGQYLVKINYLGFKALSRSVDVEDESIDLGVLLLVEDANDLLEVQVVGQVATGVQRGDTTQFNAAAFKTAVDASAQELIQKLPGVTMEDGKVQAQGEDVQQILIDGKPYFGTDVAKALQSLPAEVIANIQIFDKKSDKAELSGFDDNEQLKTINIVTKPNRRKGQFGKTTAGYGTNDRYMLGASVNLFNEDRRFTITGLSNNINTTNFTSDQSTQGGDRPRNGIIKTNLIGVNYSDMWGSKVEASGSYTYNNQQNFGVQSRFQDFVSPADSGRFYRENSQTLDKDATHRANMRIDYKINENNRILIRPNLTIQGEDNFAYFLGRTENIVSPLNQTENTSNSDNASFNFRNMLLYSHRFGKPGRSATIRLNTGYSTDNNENFRLADNVYFREPDRSKVLNQYTDYNRTGYSWEAELSYTEPIGKNGRIELEHERGNRFDDSDRRLYDYDELTGNYSYLNVGLSNSFKSEYLTEETGLSYQYRTDKVRFQVEGEYQRAKLENDQLYPSEFDMNRTFKNFLPSARFEYKFSKTNNIELDYRTWTDAPSISQLQSVFNISNPLYVRTGNPNLVQAVQNRFRGRYRAQNPENNHTFFAMVESSVVPNYIGTSTITARRPIPLTVIDTLQIGSQLSRPVNLDGYWTIRTFMNYGQPINFVKSKLSLFGFINHTRLPSLIDSLTNYTSTTNFRLGVSLSSNISESLDFYVSTRSGYNIVNRSLRQTTENYFNQSTRMRLTWVAWKGFVYRTDLIHQLNTGLSAGFNTNYMIWNMSIGKKVFANQRGEISLSVYDLLKQNVSIRRNVTDIYVEDVQSNVLQRYFMLTFTYNLRHFSGGATEKDFERQR